MFAIVALVCTVCSTCAQHPHRMWQLPLMAWRMAVHARHECALEKPKAPNMCLRCWCDSGTGAAEADMLQLQDG